MPKFNQRLVLDVQFNPDYEDEPAKWKWAVLLDTCLDVKVVSAEPPELLSMDDPEDPT